MKWEINENPSDARPCSKRVRLILCMWHWLYLRSTVNLQSSLGVMALPHLNNTGGWCGHATMGAASIQMCHQTHSHKPATENVKDNCSASGYALLTFPLASQGGIVHQRKESKVTGGNHMLQIPHPAILCALAASTCLLYWNSTGWLLD